MNNLYHFFYAHRAAQYTSLALNSCRALSARSPIFYLADFVVLCHTFVAQPNILLSHKMVVKK
jgi:hypothetical protein